MAAARLDAIDVTLAQLEASSATLARALLDLDARAAHVLPALTPDPAVATKPSPPGGQTAACLERVRDRQDWLWDRFSALSDVLSRARDLRTGTSWQVMRRIDELEALLHRASVARQPPPPHAVQAVQAGTTSVSAAAAPAPAATSPSQPGPAMYPEDLLLGTIETVAATNADLDALETARFGNLAVLAAAERQVAEAVDLATPLGVGVGVPELAAARSGLDAVAAAIATDPMAVGASELAIATEAVRLAVDAVAALRQKHDSLDHDLQRAAGLLGDVAAVAAAGQASARTVVERVTGTDAGLMKLADDWYDHPTRGLRPWLDRLTAWRDAGDWQRASRGLAAWLDVATATLAAARQVAEGNAAPLQRRDELRGLLRALHAKAVRNDLAEDPDLGTLFRRAREALYTSPTDLDVADGFVRTYAARLAECTDHQERTP